MRNAMIIDGRTTWSWPSSPSPRAIPSPMPATGRMSLHRVEDITIYHKIATRDIAQGEPVVKYGEHIGIASCPIKAGEHVHVHNVEGHRENLEAKE